MKKTRVFFLTLLVMATLFGFSGKSYAFDMSKVYSKPVEWAKYVIEKLSFGDDEDTAEAEPEDKFPAAEGSAVPVDLNSHDFAYPLFGPSEIYSSSDYMSQSYVKDGLQRYREKVDLNYSGEDWNLKIVSRTGEIITPVNFQNNEALTRYNQSTVPVFLTTVEYRADLPWESISRLDAEFFLGSALNRNRYSGPEEINDSFSFNPHMDYGLRINAFVKDALIELYGWSGGEDRITGAGYRPFGYPLYYSDELRGSFNGNYYQGHNLGASISYKLPFMSFFHQGNSPIFSLKTSYRFGSDSQGRSNTLDVSDQWKVGMSYEGNNSLEWLNHYGINWGIGYSYTVPQGSQNFAGNLDQTYGYHSGNINANTYWFDMKLYTMFMYLYDQQSKGGMTVLNAVYSPDLKWSYGIKANFYYGDKEGRDKTSSSSEERVSFTATYRWD